jgi:glycosyltransferase involved in cell wall biosynthesis
MERIGLSVVVPLYNETTGIRATLNSIARAAAAADRFDAEIVVVDDGSTDDGHAVVASHSSPVPVRLLSQENRGRFEARRTGLEAARHEYVLLLDAGVTLEPDALRFVAERLDKGEDVWNGHTVLDGVGPFVRFWDVVTHLAFAAYADDPRTTQFGAAEFDRFPKGTTCFLAPRELLLEGVADFRTAYADTRYANDDTPMLRAVAARRPINISPGFAFVYHPRVALGPFIRHAFHRGTVFVDGHGRAESRFFPIAIGFFPASAVAVACVVLRPRTAPALVLGLGVAAGVAARRRPPADALSFAVLAPVYALAHGAGMWRGLALAVGARPRR